MKTIMQVAIFVAMTYTTHAQDKTTPTATSTPDLDSLKRAVLSLQTDVETIKVNLGLAKKKFKRGILVASLGYSVTIAGGLMLGRKQDELGKTLLVTGGATGITGTAMMLDAFRNLSP